MPLNNFVPVETVQAGDTIFVSRPYRDTQLTITGTVERIIEEGLTRVLVTSEGIELARYTIGKKHHNKVTLLKAVAEPNEPLEMFA